MKDLVRCGYLKSADVAEHFGNPSQLNPAGDPQIVGPTGIFTQAEFDANGEFRKTASVMKMVINGFAGAGTIEMGGYDYHGGKRAEGEVKDFRAGVCMGACLQYAAARGKPLMMYVFSDGSLSSNGAIDTLGRRPRQRRMDQRQPADGSDLVPRLQPDRTRAADRRDRGGTGAPPADRLHASRTDRSRRHRRRPPTT